MLRRSLVTQSRVAALRLALHPACADAGCAFTTMARVTLLLSPSLPSGRGLLFLSASKSRFKIHLLSASLGALLSPSALGCWHPGYRAHPTLHARALHVDPPHDPQAALRLG